MAFFDRKELGYMVLAFGILQDAGLLKMRGVNWVSFIISIAPILLGILIIYKKPLSNGLTALYFTIVSAYLAVFMAPTILSQEYGGVIRSVYILSWFMNVVFCFALAVIFCNKVVTNHTGKRFFGLKTKPRLIEINYLPWMYLLLCIATAPNSPNLSLGILFLLSPFMVWRIYNEFKNIAYNISPKIVLLTNTNFRVWLFVYSLLILTAIFAIYMFLMVISGSGMQGAGH